MVNLGCAVGQGKHNIIQYVKFVGRKRARELCTNVALADMLETPAAEPS